MFMCIIITIVFCNSQNVIEFMIGIYKNEMIILASDKKNSS